MGLMKKILKFKIDVKKIKKFVKVPKSLFELHPLTSDLKIRKKLKNKLPSIYYGDLPIGNKIKNRILKFEYMNTHSKRGNEDFAWEILSNSKEVSLKSMNKYSYGWHGISKKN